MPRGSKSTASKVLSNTKAAVEAVLGRLSSKKKKSKQRPMINQFIGPLKKNEQRWDFVKSGVNTRGWREGTKAPAAIVSRLPHLGMADIKRQRVSWLTGYVYVGNGTLGALDSVYFRPINQLTNIFIGNIPILGSDLTLGAAYLRDVEKHFARKVVHDCKIRLHALQPSTANSMEVLIAPVRGSMNTDDVVSNASTAASLAYGVVAGMSRVVQAASWEEAAVEMIDFIAEGSGSKQNEYALDSDGTGGFIANNNGGKIPCAFAISGINGTTALRGTNTHSIIIEQEVSYLDFVGDNSVTEFPLQFNWMGQLEARREMQSALQQVVLRRRAQGAASDQKDFKEERPDLRRAVGTRPKSVAPLAPVPLLRAGSSDSVIVDVETTSGGASCSRKDGSKR